MKKIFNICVTLFVAIAFYTTSASAGELLTSFDFNIVGIGVEASPEYQAVPKGITTQVDTNFVSPGFVMTQEVINQLPKDYRVKAVLSGPAFQTPLQLETLPGEPFDITTLPVLGKYTLSNIRLVDGNDTVLFAATPQAVSIESITDPLVTQVTTRELSVEELIERGVTFDESNFTAYEFTAGLATESGQISISLPVIIPESTVIPNPENIPPSTNIGLVPPPVNNTAPTVEGPEIPQNLTVSPFILEIKDKNLPPMELPPIPGIVVIPGNIGFLHQYFSAIVLVTNGAPELSGLVVKDLEATIRLPLGSDQTAGTDALPGDDPIRMARGGEEYFPKILSVMNSGPDGQVGTADDISLMNPAESGQADFTIEGLKEGTHKLEFDITATLEGLPIGPVEITGKATGAVLVRNPDFTLTMGHPATVRSGEEYDLFVTVTNTSKTLANFVTVHLDSKAISGATFVDGEVADKSIETIEPGLSETVRYRLVSQRTGAITASVFESEEIKGRFILRTGVGELGIPLSPDSLILPYTDGLPTDLINAAVGLLGQAWSVATAPTGALPADILPISRNHITDRAYNLSEAGLRILIGDTDAGAVEDLAFDFFGSDRSHAGFDSLRRRSTQGLNMNRAMSSIFNAAVAASSEIIFQQQFADKVSYRAGHISVITSDAAVNLMITDDSSQRIGSLEGGTNYREIPYADQLLLKEEGINRTTLSLITKLDSASYKVEVNATSDTVFDMGIVLPDASGVLRQLQFTGVTMTPASKGWVTLLPGTNNDFVLNIDTDNDGLPDNSVSPSLLVIPDTPPRQVAATQIVPGFGPGGDKHGRNVAILFSERITKETARDVTNYLVDENEVKIANLQPGDRMVFVLLRDGIGPFFTRDMTVSNLEDTAGNVMSADQTLPIRITAEGPAAIVEGTVRRANGAPIPGATVRLMQLIWYDDGFVIEEKYVIFSEKETDADGEFHFDYVLQNDDPAGAFMLEAVDPVNNEAGQLITGVSYHGELINLDLFMKARGSISGTVLDENNVPISGVLLQIETLNDRRSYRTYSDGTGKYSFHGINVGPFSLEAVSQATLSNGNLMGILPDDGSSLTQDITIYSIGSFATGTITGKIIDPDGFTPRSGVIVKVFASNYTNWMKSSADGSYSFEGIYEGGVTVKAIDNATGEKNSVSGIVSDGETTVLDIILSGLGTVTGLVEREDGVSAEGLYVVAQVDQVQRVTSTDSTGNFSFENLPTGRIRIEVLDPKDFNKQVAYGVVTLSSDGQTGNIYLYVPAKAFASGTIEGTVYRRDGSVWPGADIRLVLSSYRYTPYQADSEGKFLIPDLALKTYRLVVISGIDVANAYANLWYDGQTKTVNLHPVLMGTVTGTTYDDDEKTLPTGADVTLTSMRPDQMGWLKYDTVFTTRIKSDPQTGSFTFPGVYRGNFSVSSSNIFRPTAVSKSGVITAEGETVDIDLILQGSVDGGELVNQMGSISGTVLMPDGSNAGEGVNVTVNFGGSGVTVTTASDGTFQFSPIIPAGNKTLIAEDPVTTLKWRGGISVPAGLDVPVEIKLLGRGSIVLTVINADDTPAPDTQIDVNGTEYPNDFAAGTTLADGTIRFDNLTEGTYAITALGSFGRGGRGNAFISSDGVEINITVKLSPTGTVTGRFFKADGQTPVPGGQVKLLQGGREIAYSVTSSNAQDLGSFTMDYVPIGDFTLEGFDPVTDRTGGGYGRLNSDGDVATVNVMVRPRGIVNGTVLNYSGTMPISGAKVYISGGNKYNYNSVTAPDGTFTFAGVPSGSFYIKTSDPVSRLNGNVTGSISYEDEIVTPVIHIAATGSIEGQVFMPDGVTPATNSYVSIRSGVTVAVDSTDGSFLFTDLAINTFHTIRAFDNNSPRSSYARILIENDGDIAFANIILQSLGTVEGTVFDTDGIIPLAGARVRLIASGLEYNQYTDANGEYRFTDVPSSPFRLAVTHPQRTTAATGSGLVGYEGETITIDMTIGPVGSVTGKVLLADGVTEANAAGIQFTGCNRTFTTVSNSTGDFLIQNIPVPCTFTLHIEDGNGIGMWDYHGSISQNGEIFDTGTIVLDDAPLRVTSVTPSGGSVNVLLNQEIKVRFSEPVSPGTVQSNSVYLKRGAGSYFGTITLDVDNTGLTFVPYSPLIGFSLYTLNLKKEIKDLAGRALQSDYSSSFTTIDNILPTVNSVSPADGSIEIDPAATMRVTFSETIDANYKDGIELLQNSAAVPTAINFVDSGRVVILTPLSPLATDDTFTISVSGVRDHIGNQISGIYTATFKTIDTILPTITELTVASNSDLIRGNRVPVSAVVADTDVAFVDFFVDNQLVGTDSSAPYSYNVLLYMEGEIIVKTIAQDSVGNRGVSVSLGIDVQTNIAPVISITSPDDGTIYGTSSTVTLSADATDDLSVSEVTLTVSGAFNYTETIASGGGKNFVPTFTFDLPASAPAGEPMIVAVVASDSVGNASEVATRTLFVSDGTAPSVSIESSGTTTRFRPGETGSATVTVIDYAGIASITCNISGAATEDLITSFAPAEKSVNWDINFQVSAGAVPHEDLAVICFATDGVGNIGDSSIEMKVADIVPPNATASSVLDGATELSVFTDIIVTFDEPLLSSTVGPATVTLVAVSSGENIAGNIDLSDGNKTINFTPLNRLAPAASYKLTVDINVTDESGNSLSNAVEITFTTDATPPEVTERSIENNSTGVPVDTNVEITFSEPLQEGTIDTGSVRLIEDSSGQDISGEVSLSSDRMTVKFTPEAYLTVGTLFRLFIADTITDVAGNRMVNDFILYFESDNDPPAIESISPFDGALDVPLNESVIVAFNESVNPDTVTVDKVLLSSANGDVPGDITISTDNKNITFQPTGLLDLNTEYTFTLGAGIEDIGGNVTSSDTVINFKTQSLGSEWGNRLKLTIDHTNIDQDLTNFPLRIHLSNLSGVTNDDVSDVFDKLGSNMDRKKIAIMTSDGVTQCYVEIENWDSVNKEADLWVKVPFVSSTEDTVLYLYYDKDHQDNDDSVIMHPHEISDDFEDGIKGLQWRRGVSTETSMVENDGTLSVRIDNGSGYRSGYYNSRFVLSGNFDIQVDFNNFEKTEYGMGFASLQLSSGSRTVLVSRSSWFSGIGTVDNTWATTSSLPNSNVSSGKLRIKRIGSALEVWGDKGDGFVMIRSWPGFPTGNASINLLVFFQDSAIGGVDFDNFIINSADEIRMGGFVGDTGDTSAHKVWDNNFKAVYHMAQDPSGSYPQVLDSTSNANHGTSTGDMTSSDLIMGQTGKAIDFDGVDDAIGTAYQGTGLTALTVEAVVDMSVSGLTYPFGFDDGTDGFYAYFSQPDGLVGWGIEGTNLETNTTLNSNNAYNFTGTFTSGETGGKQIYLDGALLASESQTATVDTINPFVIGKRRIADRFNGSIDELRVSNIVRSPEWIKATNLSNRDELTTFTLSLVPPTINPVGPITNSSQLVLSGTKGVGSAIIINGLEVVPIDESTTWTFNDVLQPGTNVFTIVSINNAGLESDPVIVNVYFEDLNQTPQVNPVEATTTSSEITLSGTKLVGNSIWVNGLEIVPGDNLTAWSAMVSLEPANNTLSITSRDANGYESVAVIVNIFYSNGFVLTYPNNNEYLIAGRTLDMRAEMGSELGITSVNFYVNNSLVGSKTGSTPFTLSYTVPMVTEATDFIFNAEGLTSDISLWSDNVTITALLGGDDDDGDGFTNATEVDGGTDPIIADADFDTDNDGLTNSVEYNLGTEPGNSDSDSDGLSDGEEVNTYLTDPLLGDSDNDGLLDGEEVNTYLSNPLDSDSDNDGLPDGWEAAYGLSPVTADTDSDGILDVDEDMDGEGLQNKWEYCLNLNPVNSMTDGVNLDGDRDTDRDGWNNNHEANTSLTSPCLADSDGDGVVDSDEFNVLGTDPNNMNDLYGSDLILTGDTIRIEGKVYFSSLALTDDSTITALDATTTQVSKVEIEVVNGLTIDSGSKIDVSGRGYMGGRKDNAASTWGRTFGNTTSGGSSMANGGSYGGMGGLYITSGFVNDVYGDLKNPDDHGSGGGGYYFEGTWSTRSSAGSNGGGLVRITAGSLILNGSIVIDGNNTPTTIYQNFGGAGSGGGLMIDASTISGNGLISANGGSGYDHSSGGGGRIAIYYDAMTLPVTNITANGGVDGYYATLSRTGGAGTIYLKDNIDDYGILIIDNGGAGTTNETPVPGGNYKRVILAGGANPLIIDSYFEDPAQIPQVNPVVATTTLSDLTISGTKAAGNAIWINGQEVVPVDDLTLWSVAVSLLPGNNTFSITSKDAIGLESTPVIVSVYFNSPIAPFLPGWANRIKLVIDHTKIDEYLTDFPVRVRLSTSAGISSSDLSAVFDELGSDANRKKIAVTASDGITQSYVEIESWDSVSKQADLWVKVPFVRSTEDTVLYLYYDSNHIDNVDHLNILNTGDVNDAFNDGARGLQWNNYSNSSKFVETSQLEVRVGQSGAETVYGGYETNYNINGDFDVNVDFSNFVTSGSHFELGVWLETIDGDRAYVHRYYSASGNANREGFLIMRDGAWDFSQGSILSNASALSGTLGIRRTGSSIKVYFNDGNSETGKTFTNMSTQPVKSIKLYVNAIDAINSQFNISGFRVINAGSITKNMTGNVGDPGERAAQEVWDSNFVAVYHMNQDPSLGIIDSSSNNINGTANGTLTLTNDPEHGSALDFNGIDSYIDFGAQELFSIDPPLTVEAVINRDIGADANYIFLGNNSNDSATRNTLSGNTSYVRVDQFPPSGGGVTGSDIVPVDEWNSVAGVYGAANDSIYVNGFLDVAGAGEPYTGGSITNWLIGTRLYPANSVYYYEGLIGEVRISNIARSDAWLKATHYSNQDNLILGSLAQSPQVNPVETTTTSSDLILSGTKATGNSIWIDGQEVVPADSSTEWNVTVSLNPGNNTLSIISKDADGNGSASVSVEIFYNASQTPYLSGWTNRMKILIDHTRIDEDLTDFPVRLHLSDSSGISFNDLSVVFNELGSDANRKKIAVTTGDGTTQNYVEIESWDTVNKEADIWVKVPYVSSTVDTVLYLYYDAARSDNDVRVISSVNDDFTGTDNDPPNFSTWDQNNSSKFIQNNTLVFNGAGVANMTKSKYLLVGDFDVQVDFGLTQWNPPSSNWNVLRFIVRDEEAAQYWGVYRSITSSLDNYSYYVPEGNGSAGGSHASGKFRITRVSGVITLYYWNGSQWKWNGNTSGYVSSTNNMSDLRLEIIDTGETSTTNEWYYDNLVINSADAISGYVGHTGTGAAKNVWDSNFAAVYHMNQDPSGTAPQIKDSTVNGNHGTSNGSMTTGASVEEATGKAIVFDGADDYIQSSRVDTNSNAITIDMLIKPDFSLANNVYLSQRDGVSANDFHWYSPFNPSYLGVFFWGLSKGDHYYSTFFADMTLVRATVSWNGDRVRMYKDGSQVYMSSQLTGTLSNSATTGLRIGSGWHGDTGRITVEETSISNVARSAGWIRASYNSGKDTLLIFDP